MSIGKKKEQLLAAANILVKKKLVARTWGNISARIDEESFIVTPSGIPYETITPDDLIHVITNTLLHGGNNYSDKNLHALIYMARPDIAAIVHTHQFWSSAVATAGRSIPPGSYKNETEKKIPCARYALPTIRALNRTVIKTIIKHNTNTVILANHGAVCMGDSLDTTIDNAEILEQRAFNYIMDDYKRLSGENIATEIGIIQYFINKVRKKGYA